MLDTSKHRAMRIQASRYYLIMQAAYGKPKAGRP